MESLSEPTIAFSSGTIADPYDLSFPENGDPAMSPFAKLLCSLIVIITNELI